MRKILIIIFFLVTYSSEGFSQVDSLESFFPLQIGNYWQYYVKHYFMFDTTYGYKSASVISDTALGNNSQTYYKVNMAFSGKPFGWDTVKYLRFDDTLKAIVEYDNTIGMGESIFFKLDAVENECWDYFGINVCCTQIDTLSIFGQNQISKSFSTQDYTPPFWSYRLAKDFGPVNILDDQSWGFTIWTSYNLVYAKINGVEYGILAVDDKENMVSNYKLFQNYPNPFNPSTVISFQLPVTSNVTLKVYDILGREVVILVNEEKLAGSYEVQFEGTGLTSGIYFYQLKTGNYSETKKMILLK